MNDHWCVILSPTYYHAANLSNNWKKKLCFIDIISMLVWGCTQSIFLMLIDWFKYIACHDTTMNMIPSHFPLHVSKCFCHKYKKVRGDLSFKLCFSSRETSRFQHSISFLIASSMVASSDAISMLAWALPAKPFDAERFL